MVVEVGSISLELILNLSALLLKLILILFAFELKGVGDRRLRWLTGVRRRVRVIYI